MSALGVALVWGALGAAGYIAGWQVHAKRAGTALVAAAHRVEDRAATGARPATTVTPAACVVTAPETGQLDGVLDIPALHLSAPVEEGTADTELNVAVGHDPSSVWPGDTGTSVLLAHDVSYFVHIGELTPGDTIVYRTACTTTTFDVTSSEVVAQGAAIPDSSTPELVLDTCYPPDALFFTDQRLLVVATEADSTRASSGQGRSAGVPGATTGTAPTPSSGATTAYTVPAPPALVAQGLTLQQNEAPMGTMTLAGQPTPTWEQSPGPLNLEAAALEAYFGGLHAAAQSQLAWWSAIAEPGLPPPAPLVGADVTGHAAPLDVEIDSSAGVPTSVVLTTTVTLGGGSAPGRYAETVTAAVSGASVVLGGWTLTPA